MNLPSSLSVPAIHTASSQLRQHRTALTMTTPSHEVTRPLTGVERAVYTRLSLECVVGTGRGDKDAFTGSRISNLDEKRSHDTP